MKQIEIAAATLATAALILLAGISGKRILMIDGLRSAAITLDVVGMLSA